jgi:hypothetical protein
MIKFPSIEQYRNAIRNVSDRAQWAGRDENGDPQFNRAANKPTLKYRGTVKLHGTNAAVVVGVADKQITYQSRERELTLTSDNAGFALYMSSKTSQITALVDAIMARLGKPGKTVAIFGEWCGGNIQTSVALNGLPKMFCIFAVKILSGEVNEDGDDIGEWIDIETIKDLEYPDDRIYNILRFGQWDIEIDFERPEIIQNDMVDITIAVETECPAGKHFGVSGIGEGVVWQCVEEGWRSSKHWFKVKGEKHSASKVKKLASVDVEVVKALEDFVELAVTEARLEQGLQNLVNEQLKPFDMTSMGDFIRWVFNDAMKEEADTVIANQLDPKKLGGPIANKARKWYMNKFNGTPL